MNKTQIFESYGHFLDREDKSVNGVSPDFAFVHPDYYADNFTNTGCWNCLACRYCDNCIYCSYSHHLTDCATCSFSDHCSRCIYVDYSNYREDCDNCGYSDNLRNCDECYRCHSLDNARKVNNTCD